MVNLHTQNYCASLWKSRHHLCRARGQKPQLTKAVYAETSMDPEATSNLEYAVIAPNTTSATA